MIPKILHYVWVGDQPKSEAIEARIKNWQNYLPDFEIKEWNESNFDIDKYDYTKEAYEKKAFAFVSDLIRMWALNEFGGIYCDVDVDIVKDPRFLLNEKAFFGLEDVDSIANGSLFGAEKNNEHIFNIFEIYESMSFDRSNIRTINEITTLYFSKIGFRMKNEYQNILGTSIYPIEYFAPVHWWNGKANITGNTVAIHEYDSSWTKSGNNREFKRARRLMIRYIIGIRRHDILRLQFANIKRIFR